MDRPNHGGNLNWAAAVAGCSTSLILDFSASINPLGPPQAVVREITRRISTIKTYPDPQYPKLRAALADWHQVSPTQILPGNGAAELLTWAAWELSQLRMTHRITPAFSDYERALQTFGVKVRNCQLDLVRGEWDIKPESNQGLIINNPHNPSGRLFSREKIRRYLEDLSLVVVDEAFMDFVPPSTQESLIDWVDSYPNLVVLRSLTKFYSLPGLRLGYAVTHPERVAKWEKWRDPWPVNSLAVVAGLAALPDKDFQAQTWSWVSREREYLTNSLQTIDTLQPFPSWANFILVRTTISAAELQMKLLKNHRILIRDCLSFPELQDGYFRVAVSTRENNQKLVEALVDVSRL